MEINCAQCPRQCHIDRSHALGFCGAPWEFWIARAALHPWEEPPISGTRGSGTVFFSGCNLRCVFCQNREISREIRGKRLDADALADLMLSLQEQGAHNINLVTPTPYALQLIPVLEKIKPQLRIPVVYNCGGYESVDTLRALEGLIDVWLPDVKYHSPDLSRRYSAAKDYYAVAEAALAEMLRQAKAPQLDADGMLTRGVIVRHLVLPGCRADSIALLESLADRFGTDRFLLSLMSQYTPQFADRTYPSLCRHVTTFEYESVASVARQLGFDGYFQERDSATAAYTPDFGQLQT